MVITPPPPIPEKHTKKPSQVSATVCSNCGTTTTPLWRRAPSGETICNACGLYLKARKTLRPTVMKRAVKHNKPTPAVEKPSPELGTCPGDGQCNGTGGSSSCAGCPAYNQTLANRHSLQCANCRTTTTPLWRRDEAGNTICNACGLYYKLHNVHRPVSMKRSVIKRRKRIIMAEGADENTDEDYELDSTSDDDEDDDKQGDERREKKRIVTKPIPKKSRAASPVPAIEDYIVPKRTLLPPPQEPIRETVREQRMPPPPYTPPLNPVSFHRKRFDPLSDYRTKLPENPYERLSEFDHAMTRLERLRRRISPQQASVLSKLTDSLKEITVQAETILTQPSSSYSNSNNSHPGAGTSSLL